VLSGAFSGIAGALFAFYNGSVFPDFAYFTKSFEPLVVALLGGVQSFLGPLVGAFGFKILEWLISRQWPIYWPLFLGSVVILVIVVLPQGFVGLVRRRAGGGASETSTARGFPFTKIALRRLRRQPVKVPVE